MSPAPSPLDMPINNCNVADLSKALEGITSDDSFGFSNGAPYDVNIAEDVTPDKLAVVLHDFANGKGSDILTVTTADQKHFGDTEDPESYDLLRVRGRMD